MPLPFQQPDVAAYSLGIADSFQHWTGNVILASPAINAGRSGDLVQHSVHTSQDPRFAQGAREDDVAEALYHAPFVLLSHGIQPDPIFRYANLAAQKLWNMEWDTFIATPSRLSAEPDAQEERERLLKRAETHGYIDNYSGIRITSDGRRFKIKNCILWNVLDNNHRKIGQAATFSKWEWL